MLFYPGQAPGKGDGWMELGQIAEFWGGLGLLLYGMTLLSEALCALTGAGGGTLGAGRGGLFRLPGPDGSAPAWLRRAGPLACAAWGAVVTAVAESSGAVTLFAMGAADAGLLTVRQAVAVCWGANLGTTATGQLLKLAGASGGGPELSVLLSPLACFGGAALSLVGRGPLRRLGQAALGFGLTFTGLHGVQAAMLPFLQGAVGAPVLARLEQDPLLAFGAGILLAAGLQSSSAAVALVQTAAGGGLLCWRAAAPLVMGTDLGTCSTILLASLGFGGQKKAARRVAAGHLAFNLIACAGGGALLWLTRGAAFWSGLASFGGVADFQMAFNGVTLAALLPLLYRRRGDTSSGVVPF